MQMASFKSHKKEEGTVIEFVKNQVGLKAQSLEHLIKPRLAGILTCECVIPFSRAVTVELYEQISLHSEVHIMKLSCCSLNYVLCLVWPKGYYGADIRKENRLGTVMLQELFNVQFNHFSLI